MGRSRLKKKRKIKTTNETIEKTDENLIKNLPDKVLIMRVNSGTKIRNVFDYSLKEFEKYGCVLWTGAGQAVGKIISCVEMFKRVHKDLHQVTKLDYIVSKKDSRDDENRRQVPRIHICLTRNPLNPSEPGYQSPDDNDMFQNPSKDMPEQGQGSKSKISSIAAEEFAKMGLRTGQKRPRGNFMGTTSIKKSREK